MTENNKYGHLDSSADENPVTPAEAVVPETSTIDKTENKTSEKEKTPPKEITQKTSPTKWLIPISLVLSVVAIVICGWLYYQSTQNSFSDDISKLSTQQNTISNKLDESSLSQSQFKQLIEQVNTLEQNNQAQKKQIISVQTIQSEQLLSLEAKLNRLNNTTKEDWKLAEAEYLIRLANQRLLLESDSKGAQTLLKNADDILNKLKDPIVFATRKALAKDIQALSATSQFDLEGSYLKLNALYDSVENLPQREPSKGDLAAVKEEASVNSTQNTIQSTLNSFWQSLRSLVIINYNHKPIKMLLPPAEYQELITGIQIQLDIAQVSLIKGESVIYQQALSRIADATTEYFDTQSDAVISFLASLTAMQQLNPTPELPQPRDSLIAMKALMDAWTNRGEAIQETEDESQTLETATKSDDQPQSDTPAGDKI
ncbi:uroporphyrinogen-III C-methyltransferase [Marinomonas colpomeniae]|uniref:Uroporphyrinogen-III C-methyltransferase n=1 Tax=Marinomonas colpomeniae TaxID=2774408 RepID=A0ABR8P386_9GAMM|nr:uroporphyrinogen-III C-methyltransferase [Marinomonas colpomeniae]MBD5772736.1 uroporphyrinogen-III C-methyltransferase [Marinomonas colpomeniae]